jgi:hypothetical protein
LRWPGGSSGLLPGREMLGNIFEIQMRSMS